MQIIYYGHGSVVIKTSQANILVDPFYPNGVPAFDFKIDYILLTHGHQDHINDIDNIPNGKEATLVSNYEVTSYFVEKGYNGIHMNHGGDKDFAFGNVKLVNAVHSSSFPDGSYAGNPVGFVITTDNRCVYIAGDTALTMDMKLIPLMCQKLDLAILPIGNTFTMGYKDAYLASTFVECQRVLGCHFDTFPPIEIDKEAAKSYFASKGSELILLDIGNSLEL